MSSKKRKALNGALLGAAVTALTVKGALASSMAPAVQGPIDDLKHKLDDARDEAVGASQRLLANPTAEPTTTPGNTQPPGAYFLRPDRFGARTHPRDILKEAAVRHGVDPKLVLAVSYWESGWDQTKVSGAGAVGLMQVEPATAQSAGPALLGRSVDINNAYDNADVGVAVLREDLDNFRSPAMALAAYYQGPTSLKQNGMLLDTQQYVEGILDLAGRMPA